MPSKPAAEGARRTHATGARQNQSNAGKMCEAADPRRTGARVAGSRAPGQPRRPRGKTRRESVRLKGPRGGVTASEWMGAKLERRRRRQGTFPGSATFAPRGLRERVGGNVRPGSAARRPRRTSPMSRQRRPMREPGRHDHRAANVQRWWAKQGPTSRAMARRASSKREHARLESTRGHMIECVPPRACTENRGQGPALQGEDE